MYAILKGKQSTRNTKRAESSIIVNELSNFKIKAGDIHLKI